MIVIYTKSGCAACTMTKKELARSGLDFREINLDDFPEYSDYVRRLGFTSVPVVETETASWSGFRPDKLRGLQ